MPPAAEAQGVWLMSVSLVKVTGTVTFTLFDPTAPPVPGTEVNDVALDAPPNQDARQLLTGVLVESRTSVVSPPVVAVAPLAITFLNDKGWLVVLVTVTVTSWVSP